MGLICLFIRHIQAQKPGKPREITIWSCTLRRHRLALGMPRGGARGGTAVLLSCQETDYRALDQSSPRDSITGNITAQLVQLFAGSFAGSVRWSASHFLHDPPVHVQPLGEIQLD